MLPQNEIFEKIAQDKGCDIAFPMKENFLLQVIKQFVERLKLPEGYNFIFGGGTSLVCAYDELTKRFSEDGDFRIVPKSTHTKSIREKLKLIANTLTDFKVEECIETSHMITFLFKVVNYDIPLNETIRPYIKMEIFFTDDLFYKPQEKQLISFYNRYAGLQPETKVLCVSLEDTAIDKISSLLWRIASKKTETPKYDRSDIRHLHDLAYLYPKLNIDEDFKKYVLQVGNHDIKERLKSDKTFTEVVNEVLSELKNNKTYKNDFRIYVENMSYEQTDKQLTFEKALESFEKLISKIVSV